MMKFKTMVLVFVLMASTVPAFGADEPATPVKDWLALVDGSVDGSTEESSAATGSPAAGGSAQTGKAPPLPFHCIEGYSGGAITPMAYLCHPGSEGSKASVPSAAYSFINMGSKKLHVFSVTQVFFCRLEFGYAYNWLDAGSLYDDVRKAGMDMGRDHVQLHHFNLRAQLLTENSFDLPLPAVTVGVHFKYNDGIEEIDKSLGGAFTAIGYESRCGVDYTLTGTKMFPKLVFGRPLILTGGLRFSNAAQLGFFGFGNQHNLTFEGSVVYLPIDQVCLGYEFRMKNNPYNRIPRLADREDHWHAFSVSWIVNDRLTISGVYGLLGNVGNAKANCSLGLQIKYEF